MERLRQLVPRCFQLDLFDGRAYVGLVPFIVPEARIVGLPVSLSFVETNVRTYVRLVDGSEPGVYFFSLDAGSLLATLGARAAYGLPYFWAEGGLQGGDYWIRRRIGRSPRCRVRYRVGESLGPAVEGTLDHFLVERYVLHVRRGPTRWSVRVRHQPYPLREVTVEGIEDELVAAAGISLTGEPLVHFASGVDVAIMPARIRWIA